MFGHWMDMRTEKHALRLGPIRREDMPLFIAEESGMGMQSYEVMKFLGRTTAQTLASEYAWWDKAATDPTIVNWGVYVLVDETWRLIGNTSLKFDEVDSRRAMSGFLLFDRQYWRQGIASTCHLARTRFAFEEMGLLAINSHANVSNTGSNRALLSVGYVQTGVYYCSRTVHGQAQDVNDYLLPNPVTPFWNLFWNRPKSAIPPEFHEARKVTRAALKRAHQYVTFL